MPTLWSTFTCDGKDIKARRRYGGGMITQSNTK
jgi:hypothetical protein